MKSNPECWKDGFKDGIPICLGYIAVSFTFGIMARKAGLTTFQACLLYTSNHLRADDPDADPSANHRRHRYGSHPAGRNPGVQPDHRHADAALWRWAFYGGADCQAPNGQDTEGIAAAVYPADHFPFADYLYPGHHHVAAGAAVNAVSQARGAIRTGKSRLLRENRRLFTWEIVGS